MTFFEFLAAHWIIFSLWGLSIIGANIGFECGDYTENDRTLFEFFMQHLLMTLLAPLVVIFFFFAALDSIKIKDISKLFKKKTPPIPARPQPTPPVLSRPPVVPDCSTEKEDLRQARIY